jgi:hypothetical protein
MTPRIVTCSEPLGKDELYLTVQTPDDMTIIHIYSHKTDNILSIKELICDRFYAYASDLDLFLIPDYSHSISSHTLIGTLKSNEIHFIVLNYSATTRIPLKYIKTNPNGYTFYLNHVYATDLTYVSEWLCTDRFNTVEVDTEHPRIAEIMMMVAMTAVRPEITKLEAIYIHNKHRNINHTFLPSKTFEIAQQLLSTKNIPILMKYDAMVSDTSVQTWLKNVPVKETVVQSA